MSKSKQANKNAYLSWKTRVDTKEYNKKAFAKHKDRIYERSKKARSDLKDYIIVKYLRAQGWDFEDITPELIELKRQQIIFKRLINGKMEIPNDINSRVIALENENKRLSHKNKILIDAIIILKNGVHCVANWDDELEDIYADTGYWAQEVLEKYKEKMKELNINA